MIKVEFEEKEFEIVEKALQTVNIPSAIARQVADLQDKLKNIRLNQPKE